MMPFEFTPIDAPDADDADRRQIRASLRPSDTQTLKFRRCGCCGVPMWAEADDEVPELCAECDDRLMATRADLYLRGKHPMRKRSKADD